MFLCAFLHTDPYIIVFDQNIPVASQRQMFA